MSMFDKLLRKGKQMAGEYVREQLNQRSSNSNQRGYGDSQRGYQQNPGGYQPQQQNYGDRGYGNAQASGVSREDQAAIEKYRYMLRTAPPQDMERAHAEAFARLTPQQRELLHRELSEQLPPAERPMTQDQGTWLVRRPVRRCPVLDSWTSCWAPAADAVAWGWLLARLAAWELACLAVWPVRSSVPPLPDRCLMASPASAKSSAPWPMAWAKP